MALILKVASLIFLLGAIIDGAFDYGGFDPWDHSADLSSGYFTLLSISVTAAGAYTAWELYRFLRRPTSLGIVYGAIAILFQPFVKVEFDYETWLWIDLIVLVFIASELYMSVRIGRALIKFANEQNSQQTLETRSEHYENTVDPESDQSLDKDKSRQQHVLNASFSDRLLRLGTDPDGFEAACKEAPGEELDAAFLTFQAEDMKLHAEQARGELPPGPRKERQFCSFAMETISREKVRRGGNSLMPHSMEASNYGRSIHDVVAKEQAPVLDQEESKIAAQEGIDAEQADSAAADVPPLEAKGLTKPSSLAPNGASLMFLLIIVGILVSGREAYIWYDETVPRQSADEGVPQENIEAVKRYQKAAAQGDTRAQNSLATMYKEGQGVPQDYAEAAKWYRKAAENGDEQARFNLGHMYAYGNGVPRDDAVAVTWFRKAAQQGNTDSLYNLGLMYARGRGVLQDYIQAYKWFQIAANKGDKEALESRDIVAKLMRPADIWNAQKLAREWWHKFQKAQKK